MLALGVSSNLSATPRWEISLSVVSNGTTNELAGLFFTLSSLMLSVMQGSYKYQLLSH